MKRLMKAMSAIMLMTVMLFAIGCGKEDNPNHGNGNNGGGNGGGLNGHEYVDLNLPSGTLWATCNVGATTPEGYGDYFAWGETESKTIYDYTTYNYCVSDNVSWSHPLTKYCNDPEWGYNGYSDDLTILQASDDAATAKWGNGWCMPTADQWRELKDNTDFQWMTQDGVEGMLLTAPNGNSLFLPAAGACWDHGLNLVDFFGGYWSCSLNTDNPFYAWGIFFNPESFDNTTNIYYGMDNLLSRCYGLSVRAVRSAK